MTSIDSVTIEAADLAAQRLYADAFDIGGRLRVRESAAPASGFRGFALSLTIPVPSDVDAIVSSAVSAGATVLRPAAKSVAGWVAASQAKPSGSVNAVSAVTARRWEPLPSAESA